MQAIESYAAILDAIGLYLEFRQATDVLVDEIDGGFMVGFLVDNEQRVVTLCAEDLSPLLAESARFPGQPWPVTPGDRPSLRLRLHCLGRYLDERAATSIVVQERPLGFSVEFVGVASDDLQGMARLDELVGETKLRGVVP